MNRQPYPTDITDAQWQVLEALIPAAKPGGRPRTVNMREVLNGTFYVLRTGCAWRMLPHDLPPWGTVWYYFRTWRCNGTWQRIHDALRDQTRLAAGREMSPSAAIVDSQSVKTTEKGGLVATTPARRSLAASDTSSLTR
jgi:putative transposase